MILIMEFEKSVLNRWISRYKARGTVTHRRMVRFVKTHPFTTARDTIKELEPQVPENTVRRRLDLAGLFSYCAAKNHSFRLKIENPD
jgi:hypothetical protein